MKIITLHCDYVKFKALKKAFKQAEELSNTDEQEVKEPLVVLTAVEKGDSKEQLNKLLESVKKTAQEVKAESIVLYPYAHLSSNLAAPDTALDILKKAEEALKKEGLPIHRAPFGHYKSFELKCKGHPLSELSKEFKAEMPCCPEEELEPDTSKLLKEISRSKLDTRLLKDNDHRILGQKLNLFSFNEASPGSIFWHNNGLIIFNEMKEFVRSLLREYDYEEVSTPQILDSKLFKVSGHWSHYRENMFLTDYEGRDFGVKPMNCPGGMLIYRSNSRSYRDLPIRYAEFGLDHRKELSGVLAGLFRLVQFTQDDAHIFCTKEQIEQEIKSMLEMIKKIYKDTFNFDYTLELSTRPEKSMGDKKDWDYAEKVLESALKESKIKYKINEGDGAFYGPKIDIHIKDSLGRGWQCGTIQLDMQMPKRFELTYKDAKGKDQTPFVIHRAILGSVERFIGVLLEHLNGVLPVWLSPTQVRVINFTDRNVKACEKQISELKEQIPGLRIDSDFRNTTVQDKVRDAELMKIPYIIVIGDKEEEKGTLAVRQRGSKPQFGIKPEEFAKDIKEKIEKKF